MIRIFASLAFFLFIALSAANAAGIVVVSGGGALSVFSVEGGALLRSNEVDLEGNSGTMAIAPDRRFLYVNTSLPTSGSGKGKKHSAAIATFSVTSEGALREINRAASGWSGGYLSVHPSGKFLAGNHYGTGKAGVWKLSKDRVYRGEPVVEFELEKRAHSAVFSPDGRFLFVPATGPNKIFQLVFQPGAGYLVPNQPSSAPGPLGEKEARQPRHLLFHPRKNIAYTTNERERPGVGSWEFDPEKGLLRSLEGIPSAAGNEEGMTTADLQMTPDGRFLYVSNRDILNRDEAEGRDAIALFSTEEETGRLTFEKSFPCERIPRSIAMDQAGKHLFVSGQGDNQLGLYQIDPANGHLKKLDNCELPGKPVWVLTLNLPEK